MQEFGRRVELVFSFLLMMITAIMLCAGIAQVVSRYFLKSSLSWSEELMRYLYVWMTMLGIGLGIKKKTFTAIDTLFVFFEKKAPGAAKLMSVIIVIMQLIFFTALVILGYRFALRNMLQLSPAMRIPMGLAYLALPVGGLLGMFYTLGDVYKRISNKQDKEVKAN